MGFPTEGSGTHERSMPKRIWQQQVFGASIAEESEKRG
jgi:hypothetical protein